MDNLTNVCEATSQSLDLDNIRPTHRKGKKLLAEKKRRARINNCLMQIRHLVCEGQEENDTDLDKMEKAEILEKTLEVLTRIRQDSSKTSSIISTRKAMAIRYASGFSSCAEESIRYIQNSHLVPPEVKLQLKNHLRAIARRMEAIVQVDYRGLNFMQVYSSSTSSSSSSSSSSERLGVIKDETNSTSVVERVSIQLPNDVSEGGSYYIASPLCCSTPVVHPHMPLVTSSSLQQQEEQLMNLKSETYKKQIHEHNITSTEKCTGCTSETHTQKRSMSAEIFIPDSDSVCDQSDLYLSESNHVLHSSLSSASSKSSIHGALSSVNSPIFLQPSPILPITPIPPHRSYTYHGYEPYPSTPNFLVQSAQLRSCPSVVSNVVKQSQTPNNLSDLCVKRTENQQISPETMWRPW